MVVVRREHWHIDIADEIPPPLGKRLYSNRSWRNIWRKRMRCHANKPSLSHQYNMVLHAVQSMLFLRFINLCLRLPLSFRAYVLQLSVLPLNLTSVPSPPCPPTPPTSNETPVTRTWTRTRSAVAAVYYQDLLYVAATTDGVLEDANSESAHNAVQGIMGFFIF